MSTWIKLWIYCALLCTLNPSPVILWFTNTVHIKKSYFTLPTHAYEGQVTWIKNLTWKILTSIFLSHVLHIPTLFWFSIFTFRLQVLPTMHISDFFFDIFQYFLDLKDKHFFNFFPMFCFGFLNFFNNFNLLTMLSTYFSY